MTLIDSELIDAELRPGVAENIDGAWSKLGNPGVLFTGAERQAMVAEARRAIGCELCAQRKEALSPYAVEIAHEPHGVLAAAVLDAVHRIVTDSGRLSSRWHREFIDSGLSDAHLVELTSTVVQAIGIDTFYRALGLDGPALPEVVVGDLGGEISAEACAHSARVPTVPPDAATGLVADFYSLAPFVANIWKSLTLVPSAAVDAFSLMGNWYSPGVAGDVGSDWTLIQPQVELIAASVSDYNDCFY